jgi:hypothetical protein
MLKKGKSGHRLVTAIFESETRGTGAEFRTAANYWKDSLDVCGAAEAI